MGKVKQFSNCRQRHMEKWLAKAARPFLVLHSITPLVTSPTPAIIDRNPVPRQLLPDFIGPFSKHLDLLET